MSATAASPEPGGAPAIRRTFDVLNGWADRIFVVTLERALERQAFIRAQLGGLAYTFQLGVDKETLDRDRLACEGLHDPRPVRRISGSGKPLTPGQLGAALSHRRIWEEIVRHGWRRVVILEDDVAPRPDGAATLPEALEELPEDFDLLYLGCGAFDRVTAWDRAKRAAYIALSPLRVVRWRPGEALRLHPRAFSPHLRHAGLHTGTYAYAISNRGARRLLAAQTPVRHAADHALSWLVLSGELSAFVVTPRLFDERSDLIAGKASYVRL